MYHIYEPELFAVGQKRALWRGLYGREREAGLADFVERLPTLVSALANFVRRMRFHPAPLTCANPAQFPLPQCGLKPISFSEYQLG
jgi:hypothetical protein